MDENLEMPESRKNQREKENHHYFSNNERRRKRVWRNRNIHEKRLCLTDKHHEFRRQIYPGIFEPLSPKSLYPRPPSSFADKPKIPRILGCSGMTTHGMGKMTSSSGNGSSSSSGSSGNGVGGSGGLGMDSGLFGGGNVGKGSGNGNKNGGQRSADMDLDAFEYPDSPTSQKWLENPDLIPLTVLDDINLKTEFPYASNTTDINKPPDINSINIDHLSNADNLFQFTASIPPPVPDAAASNFLDLPGNETDSFSQSLYDDLVDINLNEFPNVSSLPSSTVSLSSVTSASASSVCPTIPSQTNNLNAMVTLPPSTAVLSTVLPTPVGITSAPSKITLPAKPLTLDSLEQNATTANLMSSISRLKAELPPICISAPSATQLPAKPAIDIGSLSLSLLPLTAQAAVAALAQASNAPPVPASVMPTSNIQTNPLPSVIKNLVEPLPASALKEFIKVEPESVEENNSIGIQMPQMVSSAGVPSPSQVFTPAQCFNIKIESNNNSIGSSPFQLNTEPTPTTIFTPISLSSTPCNIISNAGEILGTSNASSPILEELPAGTLGGGKMKSSLTRKKSTCSTSSNSSSGTSSGVTNTMVLGTNSTISSNTPSANDEEDISNIPSLQMRIQIISQRVSKACFYISYLGFIQD